MLQTLCSNPHSRSHFDWRHHESPRRRNGKDNGVLCGYTTLPTIRHFPRRISSNGSGFLYIKILLLRLLHTREQIAPHRMASQKCPWTKLITCGATTETSRFFCRSIRLEHYDITHNGPWPQLLEYLVEVWPSSSWRSSSGFNN